jgi:hypothetical protein
MDLDFWVLVRYNESSKGEQGERKGRCSIEPGSVIKKQRPSVLPVREMV